MCLGVSDCDSLAILLVELIRDVQMHERMVWGCHMARKSLVNRKKLFCAGGVVFLADVLRWRFVKEVATCERQNHSAPKGEQREAPST